MASIWKDPHSGRYHVRFRYAGVPYKRALGTAVEGEARAALVRINDTVKDIKRGRLQVPDGADPGLFIVSDGKIEKKPEAPALRTLADLFRIYEESLPNGAKEDSTLIGERIHMKHLKRHLGGQRQVRGLQSSDLQIYVNRRSRDKWNGRPIRGDTIAKEITTFRLVWNWAVKQGHLTGKAPVEGLEYPKRDEREPFLTWGEIEKRIARGGLSGEEEEVLWECLYLTREQIDEVLKHVKETARHPFIYPMFVFAAHTGARRSEILRSQIDDFAFEDGFVRIREKKKSRDRRITYRRVELSPLLADVMQRWFADHPGGAYTITPPLQVAKGKRGNSPRALTPYEAHDHFKRTLADSRWEKIRGFHVFRHSFSSNAAFAGVPEPVIDAWMGHQTVEMRERYRHLFPEQRRTAIELVFGGAGK
jgi:integrase